MSTIKIAISVPRDVVDAVDRAATARGTTRSGFIAEVLRHVARAKRDREIRKRIDEVLSDIDVADEQRATAADYRRIQPRRGTEW